MGSSIIDKQGGSDVDMKAQIDETTVEFLKSKNIWNLKELLAKTEVRIFNANTETVLLYRVEISRTTTTYLLHTSYQFRRLWRDSRDKSSPKLEF